MKIRMLFAATAALMISAYGQDAKVAQPPATPTAAPSERMLTEADLLKYQVSALQIDRLRKIYKIDEFNEKVQPYSSDQQAWYVATCKSIGLTDEQIKAQECGVNVGIDLDGKPITGQDGKPVVSRVWHADPPKKDEKK